MPPRARDDNWIDGLRGLASLLVVTGHVLTAFAPALHTPAFPPTSAGDQPDNGDNSGYINGNYPPPDSPIASFFLQLFQTPPFRLVVGGRAAVALFFVVSGLVNSLGPIRCARAGDQSATLRRLARATLGRAGRLVLPASVATVVAWLLAQTGAFGLATRADAPWISGLADSVPGVPPDQRPSWTWADAICSLVKALILPWGGSGFTQYDRTHWTMVYFLMGSLRVYTTLLALSLLHKRAWYIVNIFLYVFAWITGDYLVGLNIYAGIFLAQLQVDLGPRTGSLSGRLPRVGAAILLFVGLLLASYPQEHPDWAAWSLTVQRLAHPLFIFVDPSTGAAVPGGEPQQRYIVSMGVGATVAGVFFSRRARRLLTVPILNFAGRVSFAVYLLHGSLVRMLLVALVYGPAALCEQGTTKVPPAVDENNNPIPEANVYTGPLPRVSTPVLVLIDMPLFFAVLYAVGYAWSLFVDPWCTRVVGRITGALFAPEAVDGTGNSKGGHADGGGGEHGSKEGSANGIIANGVHADGIGAAARGKENEKGPVPMTAVVAT